MAFSRTAALRSCIRGSRPTVFRPQLFRSVARREYASGHSSAKASGDAVWAAGAVAITIPACWYLLSNAADASHGHGDHGDAHGKSHDKEEHEEVAKKGEEPEQTDGEKSEDSGSDDVKKGEDTPDTSDDEGKEESEESSDDRASASKEDGGKNPQSEEQEGLTNTNAKHFADNINDPTKSKSAESIPETVKPKETVDPNRPQPEEKK